MQTMQESPDPESGPAKGARGLLLHADDNVAVVLGDAECGPMELLGTQGGGAIVATEPIDHGHKIALRAIAAGEPVIKYGVPIGFATAAIAPGAWVHTHNCRSALDKRSHTLDRHSGAPTDTRYV
jgi:hypothetical protein